MQARYIVNNSIILLIYIYIYIILMVMIWIWIWIWNWNWKVSAFESVISKGGKVAEKTLLNLIELLMNQLLKLDGIMAEGDVKLQRKMQVFLFLNS